MKRSILLAGFGVLVFGAGFFVSRLSMREGRATIIVRNESLCPISHLVIQMSDLTLYYAGGIEEGNSATIRIRTSGEDGYRLIVFFPGGDSLVGGAGYIESGYRIRETISDSSIRSEYVSLYGG